MTALGEGDNTSTLAVIWMTVGKNNRRDGGKFWKLRGDWYQALYVRRLLLQGAGTTAMTSRIILRQELQRIKVVWRRYGADTRTTG